MARHPVRRRDGDRGCRVNCHVFVSQAVGAESREPSRSSIEKGMSEGGRRVDAGSGGTSNPWASVSSPDSLAT